MSEAPTPPPKVPSETELRTERRQERLFRVEIVKTVFSILATLGTVTAIFLTYAGNDFKDTRASLDSVINRLTEPTGAGRPVFRQTSAAALLPYYHEYRSAFGSHPFRQEIRSLLSGFFREKMQTYKILTDPALSQLESNAGSTRYLDLRNEPEVNRLLTAVNVQQRALSEDPLVVAMSGAMTELVGRQPQVVSQLLTTGWRGSSLTCRDLKLQNGTLIQLDAGCKLTRLRLGGAFTMLDMNMGEFPDARLDVYQLTWSDLSSSTWRKSQGRIEHMLFVLLEQVDLRDARLTLDTVLDCRMSEVDLGGSQITGGRWEHVDLESACLVDTRFAVEEIYDVNFAGAMLCGADLSGVKRTQAVSWDGAIFDEKTRPPEGVDLAKAGALPATRENLKGWLELWGEDPERRVELGQRLFAR